MLTSTPSPLQPGQKVAARVPYTKRRKEWIIALVEQWSEETNLYIVRDLFPEHKRKNDVWSVTAGDVIPFPSPEGEAFEVGDNVLSLWYIPENKDWSSMFYEAKISRASEVDTDSLFLCFNGESRVYEIDKSKVVKIPRYSEDRHVDSPPPKSPKASKIITTKVITTTQLKSDPKSDADDDSFDEDYVEFDSSSFESRSEEKSVLSPKRVSFDDSVTNNRPPKRKKIPSPQVESWSSPLLRRLPESNSVLGSPVTTQSSSSSLLSSPSSASLSSPSILSSPSVSSPSSSPPPSPRTDSTIMYKCKASGTNYCGVLAKKMIKLEILHSQRNTTSLSSS